MFSSLFSKMGWTAARVRTERAARTGADSESDAEAGASAPPDAKANPTPNPAPTTRQTLGAPSAAAKSRNRNFSETEFMDSGLARSLTLELPFANLQSAELDALEYDHLFLEEYILSRLQDVQRRLHTVREKKSFLRDAVANKQNFDGDCAGGASTPASTRQRRQHLFVASYRLPLIVEIGDDGKVKTNTPPANLGLVSAFRDLLDTMPIRWLGAPAQTHVDVALLSSEERVNLKKHFCSSLTQSIDLLRYVPLFLSRKDIERHQQFCNSVIWPLFHYMPLSFEGERTYHIDTFDAYERVNVQYAESLIEEWRATGVDESDAYFWIHDFHLLLVPKILRDRLPNARIGFFLHTPFPAGEVFRTLPPRKELLEGILGADLVGFHTYDYARHFLSACERLLGLDVRPNGVDDKGVFVRVGIYPFGIDADIFRAAMEKNSVNQQIEQIKRNLGDKKIIVGVDRLDYIKGIPHKLLAIEHFLETHPEWIGRIVVLQVTTPSGTASEEYQSFRSEILELVGRINGRFATLKDMPIHYREITLGFEELCALYAVADVAVMTSLRDGMNLASYEYVMCQRSRNGALVLSEFTGAAQNLPGAILCNPWNTEEVSDAIFKSLTMPDLERELKHQKLYRYVSGHTSASWGVHFIQDLRKYAKERRILMAKLVELPAESLKESYDRAKGLRLILLDYDGTIRKYESQPELADPSERLREMLRRLGENERNLVFIITGRQKVTMIDWLGDLRVGFAVEHGFSLRWPDHVRERFGGSRHRSSLQPDLSSSSLSVINEPREQHELGVNDQVKDDGWDDLLGAKDLDGMREALAKAGILLHQIEDYTPTSFVSVKESAYSWHFRDADPDFAGSRALDARLALEEKLAGSPMEVLMGHKILYVRPKGVNKGAAVDEIFRRLRSGNSIPSWVLSVGDDRTDEDMFHALDRLSKGEDVVVNTCTVGRKTTIAKFFVESVDDVLDLLDSLNEIDNGD